MLCKTPCLWAGCFVSTRFLLRVICAVSRPCHDSSGRLLYLHTQHCSVTCYERILYGCDSPVFCFLASLACRLDDLDALSYPELFSILFARVLLAIFPCHAGF